MRINFTNSFMSARMLSRSQKAIARSLERMASGERINSAKDDPAGLAMATHLDAETRGIAQSIRNVNDAQGLLNTIDSAFSSQMDLLQRMREIAVQASNGILSVNDRANLNNEMQSLYDEFQRLSRDTQFGDIRPLDGSKTSIEGQIDLEWQSSSADDIFGRNVGTGIYGQYGTTVSFAEVQYSTTGRVNGAQFVDLDRDGKQDILYTTDTEGLGWFYNVEDFAIEYFDNSKTPVANAKTADFTNDAWIDVIATDGGSSFYSYVNNGSGNPVYTAMANAIGTIQDYALEDVVGGDGILDIVYTDNGVDAYSIKGNNDGTFTTSGYLGSWTYSQDVVTSADVNTDGYEDAVSHTSDYWVNLSVSEASLTSSGDVASYTNGGAAPSGIELVDINGDSFVDMIAASNTTNILSVWLNTGAGSFASRQTYLTSGVATDLTMADTNNDGNLDAITSRGDILRGNGDGTFQTYQNYSIGGDAGTVKAGDVNNDGIVDIVTSSTSSTSINVLIGLANGSFQSVRTYATPTISGKIEVGDINNDGNLDIIALGTTTSTYAMTLFGSGNGSFSSATTLANASGGAYSLALADMNDDGNLDLIASTLGFLNVHLNSGSGSFGTKTSYASDNAFFSVQAVDLNEDGILDIVGGGFAAVNVFMGRGNGALATKTRSTAGAFVSDFDLADLNNDGALEIVVADNTSLTLNKLGPYYNAASDISVASEFDATLALDLLDDAINNLSERRAQVGALQRSLESHTNFLEGSNENLAAARSQVIDVDYSLEMSEIVRQQILQQAQVSALAQSNLQMQVILNLFR